MKRSKIDGGLRRYLTEKKKHVLCCAAEEQGKERRESRGEVVEEGTSLLSFAPKFLQFFSFFSPPITSDLSNYFLSCLKSSLEPVYTLTLPINTSFQILIIIIDCNCQIKSQFLLHFSFSESLILWVTRSHQGTRWPPKRSIQTG